MVAKWEFALFRKYRRSLRGTQKSLDKGELKEHPPSGEVSEEDLK